MGKYTKVPVTIDAYSFNEMIEFGKIQPGAILSMNGNTLLEFSFNDRKVVNNHNGTFTIETLEGNHIMTKDDMLIIGVKGEMYHCKIDIFNMTYLKEDSGIKSLHNTCANGAKKNVKDIVFWGDGDMFKLISKASSENEGWMKSTKAMQCGSAVVVQVTTQQRNPDGSYSIAEALTTVYSSKIEEEFKDDKVISRKIVEIGR